MRYETDEIPEQQIDFIARASAGTVSKSGNDLADGVLSGYEWKGGSITYAFPDSKSDYGYKGEKDNGFGAVNDKIADAARQVLDAGFGSSANNGFSVEGFTNLGVSEGSDKDADIRYAKSKEANPTAYAYYPIDGFNGMGGDVWFGTNSTYNQPEVGNYAYATVLHETGHALGLKHGHQATSGDQIKTTLEGKYDSLEYSVMTYHSYAGQTGASGYTNEKFGFPQSYMMADIAALQHMYGADFTTNNGDTVYSWAPGSGKTFVDGVAGISPGANRIFATIWDGGGTDTYDLSDYSNHLMLDLRPGKFSVFKEGQLADLDSFHPNKHLASGNIYNALQYQGKSGSLIENAIGGSAGDKFTGNNADNTFTGGKGGDTFVFKANCHDDTINDFGTGADVINVKDFGFESFDALVSAMTEDGSGVTIDFGDGDTLLIVEATIAGLEDSDFVI